MLKISDRPYLRVLAAHEPCLKFPVPNMHYFDRNYEESANPAPDNIARWFFEFLNRSKIYPIDAPLWLMQAVVNSLADEPLDSDEVVHAMKVIVSGVLSRLYDPTLSTVDRMRALDYICDVYEREEGPRDFYAAIEKHVNKTIMNIPLNNVNVVERAQKRIAYLDEALNNLPENTGLADVLGNYRLEWLHHPVKIRMTNKHVPYSTRRPNPDQASSSNIPNKRIRNNDFPALKPRITPRFTSTKKPESNQGTNKPTGQSSSSNIDSNSGQHDSDQESEANGSRYGRPRHTAPSFPVKNSGKKNSLDSNLTNKSFNILAKANPNKGPDPRQVDPALKPKPFEQPKYVILKPLASSQYQLTRHPDQPTRYQPVLSGFAQESILKTSHAAMSGINQVRIVDHAHVISSFFTYPTNGRVPSAAEMDVLRCTFSLAAAAMIEYEKAAAEFNEEFEGASSLRRHLDHHFSRFKKGQDFAMACDNDFQRFAQRELRALKSLPSPDPNSVQSTSKNVPDQAQFSSPEQENSNKSSSSNQHDQSQHEPNVENPENIMEVDQGQENVKSPGTPSLTDNSDSEDPRKKIIDTDDLMGEYDPESDILQGISDDGENKLSQQEEDDLLSESTENLSISKENESNPQNMPRLNNPENSPVAGTSIQPDTIPTITSGASMLQIKADRAKSTASNSTNFVKPADPKPPPPPSGPVPQEVLAKTKAGEQTQPESSQDNSRQNVSIPARVSGPNNNTRHQDTRSDAAARKTSGSFEMPSA
jgi:hypothetical protein